MAAAHLKLAQRFVSIHGKMRPMIEVQAVIDPASKAVLLENFGNETLFRRTSYANGFSDGGLQPSPALARQLGGFLKNDACPEVTVKTLLAGQKYEGAGLWDVLCFEFIAKRSFDTLVELAQGARGFGQSRIYLGNDAAAEPNVLAFEADTAAEIAASPAAVAVGGIEGKADAA